MQNPNISVEARKPSTRLTSPKSQKIETKKKPEHVEKFSFSEFWIRRVFEESLEEIIIYEGAVLDLAVFVRPTKEEIFRKF